MIKNIEGKNKMINFKSFLTNNDAFPCWQFTIQPIIDWLAIPCLNVWDILWQLIGFTGQILLR